MIDIKGHICEVGDFSIFNEKHQPGGKSRGIVIEMGSWEVTILGLTKEQCRELGACLGEPINVRMEFTPNPEAKP